MASMKRVEVGPSTTSVPAGYTYSAGGCVIVAPPPPPPPPAYYHPQPQPCVLPPPPTTTTYTVVGNPSCVCCHETSYVSPTVPGEWRCGRCLTVFTYAVPCVTYRGPRVIVHTPAAAPFCPRCGTNLSVRKLWTWGRSCHANTHRCDACRTDFKFASH